MADDLPALIGQWVQITTSEAGIVPFSSTSSYFGVIEGIDGGAVILRTWLGETLYLPRVTVRSVRVLDPPPGEKEKLLRASEAPQEESLLRPAGRSANDPDSLPRIPPSSHEESD
jgi:hypothetical protein